jgi:hypothetical protein
MKNTKFGVLVLWVSQKFQLVGRLKVDNQIILTAILSVLPVLALLSHSGLLVCVVEKSGSLLSTALIYQRYCVSN